MSMASHAPPAGLPRKPSVMPVRMGEENFAIKSRFCRILLLMALILDSSVVSVLPPGLGELARRRSLHAAVGGGGGGTPLSGGGGLVHSRLILRGGANDFAQDKETMLRGGKRSRRADDQLDANYVESLHTAMARADAAKLMNLKSRPAQPGNAAKANDERDVDMKGGDSRADASDKVGWRYGVDGDLGDAQNAKGARAAGVGGGGASTEARNGERISENRSGVDRLREEAGDRCRDVGQVCRVQGSKNEGEDDDSLWLKKLRDTSEVVHATCFSSMYPFCMCRVCIDDSCG